MGNPLRGLDEVRLDRLIQLATQRLRQATLEELAAIVNGIPSRPPVAVAKGTQPTPPHAGGGATPPVKAGTTKPDAVVGQIQGGTVGSGNFSFLLSYAGPLVPFSMDIQQVVFLPGVGVVFGTKQDFFFNGASFVPGVYGAGGGPAAFQGPVPEPTSLLVLGLGLAGFAIKRRRSARIAQA